jgi:hypothetical protein
VKVEDILQYPSGISFSQQLTNHYDPRSGSYPSSTFWIRPHVVKGLKDTFSLLDKDGDGVISGQDFSIFQPNAQRMFSELSKYFRLENGGIQQNDFVRGIVEEVVGRPSESVVGLKMTLMEQLYFLRMQLNPKVMTKIQRLEAWYHKAGQEQLVLE